jgi:hypothetical protein
MSGSYNNGYVTYAITGSYVLPTGWVSMSFSANYLTASWVDPSLKGASGYNPVEGSEFNYFVDQTLFSLKLKEDTYINIVLMSDGRKRYVYSIDFMSLVKYLINKNDEVVIDDDFSEPYVRNTSDSQPFSIFFTTETKTKKEFDTEMSNVWI